MTYVVQILSKGTILWTGQPLKNGWFVKEDGETPDLEKIKKYHVESGIFPNSDDVILVDFDKFYDEQQKEINREIEKAENERKKQLEDPLSDLSLRLKWESKIAQDEENAFNEFVKSERLKSNNGKNNV